MKKFLAILLSAVLMLSLTVPSMAVETVTNNTNHDYKAYQIFAGTQGEGTTLGDIVWGSGIDASKTTDLMTALKAVDAFAACADAAAIAEVLAGKQDNDPVVLKFAQIVSQYLSDTATEIKSTDNSVTLLAGYYLLVDQTTTNGVQDEVKGLSLLQVTKDGNIEIKLKTDKPTVDKQVWDETADKDKNTTDANWGETADHDIGEEFQFRLIATIPADTMTYFDTYKIIFKDEMSDGITFVEIDSVTVDGKNVDSANYVENATAAANKDGLDWTLTIENVKTAVSPLDTAAAVEVVVTYTAKLNDGAVIAPAGNPNTVGLQYSNNPNVDGEGQTGNTVKDTVWVFTYEVNGTKVDGGDNTKKLSGAEFVLYRKAVDKNNTEVLEYVTLDGNKKVTGWTTTKPATGNIVTVADGIIKITGLDHGTYYLEETKAPNGYNLLDAPYEVKIDAEHYESEDTTTATTKFTVNGVETNPEITVENNAGATLPETGGIGTTIFYAVGGVMVAVAAILLITKKRMSAES